MKMSYRESYSMDEFDPEEDDYDDMEDYRDHDDVRPPAPPDSDEDTEEASETDMGNHEEPREIKEEMYQDKLDNLRLQVRQLMDYTHPEYLRQLQKLEQQYEERMHLNQSSYEYLKSCAEEDYLTEKKAAAKEFEEKKVELKENLIADFEDKKKHIENERHNMELNGDSMEVKPAMTRKLRRRPNEPAPMPDKRRKPLTTNLIYLLEDREVDRDLREITRARPLTVNQPRKNQPPPSSPISHSVESGSNSAENRAPSPYAEARVEDGKLLYDRRWYHRGQSIFVEGRDYPRFPAHITAIGSDCIWVRKTTADGNKLRIYTSLLSRGKITIKRRVP